MVKTVSTTTPNGRIDLQFALATPTPPHPNHTTPHAPLYCDDISKRDKQYRVMVDWSETIIWFFARDMNTSKNLLLRRYP